MSGNIYWDIFESLGSVDAYLLYKVASRVMDGGRGGAAK